MPEIKCTANVRYELTWNGTEEQLIELAEEQSQQYKGEPLDSHDLGDAMGLFMEIMSQGNIWELGLGDRNGNSVQISMSNDLFKWEGIQK